MVTTDIWHLSSYEGHQYVTICCHVAPKMSKCATVCNKMHIYVWPSGKSYIVHGILANNQQSSISFRSKITRTHVLIGHDIVKKWYDYSEWVHIHKVSAAHWHLSPMRELKVSHLLSTRIFEHCIFQIHFGLWYLNNKV